jgi:hypothetical protein
MALEIKKISGRTAEGVDANGNIVLYTKVLTNLSGLPMSDADVDNDTYLKIDFEYFKRFDVADSVIYQNINDFGVISDAELLGSLNLYLLENFTFSDSKLIHIAGTLGTAKTPLTLVKDKIYIIKWAITTTAAGYVDLRWNDAPIFDETLALNRGDIFYDISSEIVLETVINLPQVTGTFDFEIKTDAGWAGSISLVSIKELSQSTQFTIATKSNDDLEGRVLSGIKFGRFNAGNIAIGDKLNLAAIEAGEFGAWNVAIGARSQAGNITAYECTSVGAFALKHNQGKRNSAFGYAAGKANIIGIGLTALGYKAFTSNSVGNRNTGVGFHSALQSSTGNDNTAIGWQALYSMLKNSANTALGSQTAMNCQGNFNTFLGALAGYLDPDVNVVFNFSFGVSVGSQAVVFGDNGVSLGHNARIGNAANPVDDSVSIGANAYNKSQLSVLIGSGGVINSIAAIRAIAIGAEVLSKSDQGVTIGFRAISEGIYTVSIGTQSGKNQTGNYNTFLGAFAGNEETVKTFTNVVCIGYESKPTKSNQVVLGNASTEEIVSGTNTNLGSTDKRFNKAHLKNLNIDSLSVYTDNSAATTGGLIAGDLYRKSTGELMIVY